MQKNEKTLFNPKKFKLHHNRIVLSFISGNLRDTDINLHRNQWSNFGQKQCNVITENMVGH